MRVPDRHCPRPCWTEMLTSMRYADIKESDVWTFTKESQCSVARCKEVDLGSRDVSALSVKSPNSRPKTRLYLNFTGHIIRLNETQHEKRVPFMRIVYKSLRVLSSHAHIGSRTPDARGPTPPPPKPSVLAYNPFLKARQGSWYMNRHIYPLRRLNLRRND